MGDLPQRRRERVGRGDDVEGARGPERGYRRCDGPGQRPDRRTAGFLERDDALDVDVVLQVQRHVGQQIAEQRVRG
jgi:hypothetical protein